jgi:putative membrane protein insertion efficiency factor
MTMHTFLTAIAHGPGRLLILLVRAYQFAISPLLGKNCRFEPTCSQYMILSVEKHGVLRGSWRGVLRIMRCHPFHPGGSDPP